MIISGQKYTTKNIQDSEYPNDETKKIKVKDAYKDLVMFHFDTQGNLKAQYGIKRDKNNKWSKAILTPQEVSMSGDGKSMYWTYGELKGMRKGSVFSGGILEMAGVALKRKSCCTILQSPELICLQVRSEILCPWVQLMESRYTSPIPNFLA